MPISRREFEQGEINLNTAITNYLRDNIDNAYILGELYEELLSEGFACSEEDVAHSLSELVDIKRIEVKDINGVLYHIYSTSLGFKPS